MNELKETEGKHEDIAATLIKYFAAGLCIVISSMWFFNHMLERSFGSSAMDVRGQFGDQFGAINAIFSALAFFGLIMTLAIQTRDLRAQTKALGIQQITLEQQIREFGEQKQEMRQSAAAQERTNNLKELEFRLS